MNRYTSTTLFALAFILHISTVIAEKDKNSESQGPHYMANRRAQVSLINFDVEGDGVSLSPKEQDFFTYAWKTAFNSVHYGPDDFVEETVESANVIDFDGNGDHHNIRRRYLSANASPLGNRRTRGAFWYPWSSYWNVYLFVDYSCTFCGDDDGYRKRNLRTLSNNNESDSNEEKSGTRDTNDEKQRSNTERDFWEGHRRFEMLFCEILREGPYDSFRDIQDCRVVYLPN